MRIVIGRGNRRTSVVVPTGAIVRNAPEAEQRAFVANVRGVLGVAEAPLCGVRDDG